MSMSLETPDRCLNFCKYTEIRQSEPFAVRLAQAMPAGKRPPGTKINGASPITPLYFRKQKILPLFLPLYRKKRETGTVNLYSFSPLPCTLEKLLKSSSTFRVNLRSNHFPTNHSKKITTNIINVRIGCVTSARTS